MSQVTGNAGEHSSGGNRLTMLLAVWGFIGAAIVGIHLYQASVEGMDVGTVTGLVGGLAILGLVARDLATGQRRGLVSTTPSDLTYVITLFVLSILLYVLYVIATTGI